MKKRIFGLILSLAMICAMVIPVLAYEDYGVIYDVTGNLGSETVRTVGEETLPGLSEQSGIDLRVDIVRNLEDHAISEYAQIFYEKYEYGYGADNDGILLMMYIIEEDGDDLGWGDFYLYGKGRGWDVLNNSGSTIVYDLEQYLNDDSWEGDLESDREACSLALQNYAADVGAAISELGYDDGTASTSHTSAVEDLQTYGDTYVFDQYGALTDSQRSELERRAADISDEYQCGVYIAVVNDYTDFDSRVYYASEDIFTQANMGLGSGGDGILLLLSMAERDYDITAHGYGNVAFTDYGKRALAEFFLDDFRSNSWYDGLSDYLETCARYLKLARDGKPVDVNSDPDHINWGRILFRVALIVLLPMVVAGVVVGIFWAQMKSVRIASNAGAYVPTDGLNLTVSEDVYTHTTVNRVHIERNNSSSGGTSVNSGGFSHSSGKF